MEDDATYLNMLQQMGLSAAEVPGDMRESIYKKLGLKLPQAAIKQ
jgi:hypothetical protein